MKIFVLQNKQFFDVNWEDLANKMKDPGDNLYLITTPALSKLLSAKDQAVFDGISILTTLELDSTERKIREYCNNAQDVKIITNDEYCVELCAALNQKFNQLSGYQKDKVFPYLNKVIMKEILTKSNILTPKFMKHQPDQYQKDAQAYISQVISKIGFPLIAKPMDEANNRDITLVQNEHELNLWCQTHQAIDKFELEEFINGTLLHCNSVFINGSLETLMVGKYLNPCLAFENNKPIGSIFLIPDSELYKKISEFNRKVLTALPCPENCVFHLELFEKEGKFYFLEIACRAPGAMLPKASVAAFGYNLAEFNYLLQVDGRSQAVTKILSEKNSAKNHVAWVWFPAMTGTVSKIKNFPVNCHYDINWNLKKDDVILPRAQRTNNVACSMLMVSQNYQDLVGDFNKLQNFMPFEVQDFAAQQDQNIISYN